MDWMLAVPARRYWQRSQYRSGWPAQTARSHGALIQSVPPPGRARRVPHTRSLPWGRGPEPGRPAAPQRLSSTRLGQAAQARPRWRPGRPKRRAARSQIEAGLTQPALASSQGPPSDRPTRTKRSGSSDMRQAPTARMLTRSARTPGCHLRSSRRPERRRCAPGSGGRLSRSVRQDADLAAPAVGSQRTCRSGCRLLR